MSDTYDEDEDRLMIDDKSDVNDSSANLHTIRPANSNSFSGLANSNQESVASPSVECKSKHRTSDLKMHIKKSQNSFGVNKANTDEYRLDDSSVKLNVGKDSVDGVKEDGEIEDEDERINGAFNIRSLSSQKTLWSSNFESVGDDSEFRIMDNEQNPVVSNYQNGSETHSHHQNLAASRSCQTSKNSVDSMRLKDLKIFSNLSSPFLSNSHSGNDEQENCNARFQSKRIKVEKNDEMAQYSLPSELLAASSTVKSVERSNKSRRKKNKRHYDGECILPIASSSNMCATSSVNIKNENETNRKRKHHMRDKSTCVSVRSVQTCEDDIDVQIGMRYCMEFSVVAKFSNALYFVTNWNGHELCGVLGDGGPVLRPNLFNKRKKTQGNSIADEVGNSNSFEVNNSTSVKNRSLKRHNRSSSACPMNGVNDIKQTGKKNSFNWPTSGSAGELLSMIGENDDEKSQSPIFWLNSGGSDPYDINAPCKENGSHMHIAEVDASTLPFSCPVVGCEYRYDNQAQLTFHYQDHFDKINKRAIFVEPVGTQTELVGIMKDVGTDPMVEDFTEPVAETSPELFVNKDHQPHIDSSANCASQVRLTPMLSNMEQQSINELFKVVERKDEKKKVESNSTTSFSTPKKCIAKSTSKISDISKSRDGLPKLINDAPSSSTALEAMQKMVFDDHPKKESSADKCLSAGASLAVSLLGPESPSKSTSRMMAASPAFSDISDDAPTLEKEVSDKTDDCLLDRVKILMNTKVKSPLGPLSLSVDDEKLGRQSTSVTSESNQKPLYLCSTASSADANSDSSDRQIKGSSINATKTVDSSSKKIDTKDSFPSSTTSGLFPPFIGLDPTVSFPPGLPPPIGLPVSVTSTTTGSTLPSSCHIPFMYNPSYLMNFGLNSAVPQVPTSVASSKHKIHDLKTSANVSSGSKDNSCATRLSPSMIASPGGRSHSVGPASSATAGSASGISKSSLHHQQHASGSLSNSKAISKAGIPFAFPPPNSSTLQVPNDRISASSQAMNLVQQQQAHYFAAHLQQQQQQLQFMQSQMRYGFPIVSGPASMAPMGPLAAQQAYEQFAAMHAASFGAFAPPGFPPK